MESLASQALEKIKKSFCPGLSSVQTFFLLLTQSHSRASQNLDPSLLSWQVIFMCNQDYLLL